MLISRTWAGHGMPETGGAGGSALLIILAVAILLGLVYVGQKKWRRRMATRNGNDESQNR